MNPKQNQSFKYRTEGKGDGKMNKMGKAEWEMKISSNRMTKSWDSKV